MKKRVYLSAVCALVINATASDLGTIQVESSTIDDKFESKKTEVSNTTTISATKVESYHAENIADVLNNFAGVTVRRNEGDSNKIHIRGVATEMYMGEKPGVAIVIDGVPVQERAGSVNIDIDNIETIKVIKGGASYLYGNDALAGAVIITTKRAKNKNEGFASTEFGSDGYQKYLAKYNGSSEDYAYHIQGSYKKSDGYWQDSDYWTKSINGKFQYYIDDSSDVTVGIDKSMRFENDSGSITHTSGGVNQVDTNPTSVGEVGYSTKYDIDLDKYFITYSKDFDNNSNLMTQVYHYDDTTTNRSGPYDAIRNNGILRDDHLYDAYSSTKQSGLKSEYRMDDETLASMIAIDIARNKENKNSKYRVNYTSRGTTYNIGDVVSDTTSKENIYAVYGELKYKYSEDITTTLNARLDKISYDYSNNLSATSWDKDFNEPSFRLGGIYKLDDKQIFYANISSGFRVPTLTQMYAGDMATSTYSGTYTNNTDIKTEKTMNYEIGFRHNTDNVSYDVAIFQLDRKDVIGRSSGNYASTRGVNVQYDNMSDVQNRGLELSMETNKNKDAFFVFNYTYLDSKYTKYDEYNLILNSQTTGSDYVEGVYNLSGNSVPRTSKHTVYLEGNYKATPELLLTADINFRSEQNADELNRIKVKGYSIVNLRGNYNMKVSSYDINIFAKVDNVFDEQYYMMPRVTGDRNDDGVYDRGDMGLTVNPGRTLLAGASIKF
ncbi:TonB-dependent receptor [Sulfurimonas sp.]